MHGDRSAPISADELTGAIHRLLHTAGFSELDTRNLASHSMKATWLTATGKAGVDLHTRQLLGFHVPKGESSALNYCRDNLAKPMEILASAFVAVKAGEFLPDADRAGRWPLGDRVPLETQVEPLLGKFPMALASFMASLR